MIDQQQPLIGRIVKKTEMAGVGRLSQVVGVSIFLGSFAAFPIGTPIGFLTMVSLFVIGRRMATKYYCGGCGNPVENGSVTICPACKMSLK